MKKRMVALLAIVALMPISALAQHSSKASETSLAAVSKASTKAVTLSGQVSQDAKTLVSWENDIWNVSNADALAGHEGQAVVVKCQWLAGKNAIHVFTVKVAPQEVKSATNKSDSAFRR
jgi:hypothetical protein